MFVILKSLLDLDIFTINVPLETLRAYLVITLHRDRPMGFNNIKYENAHKS